MKTAEEIIEKISEIQREIEREVEWALTDYVEPKEINFTLSQINAGLIRLQLVAQEQVK